MNFTKISLCFMLIGIINLHAQESPKVKIGGALRFNYNLSSWKKGQKDRVGDFGFDVFRINAKANYKSIYLDAEYRFYSSDFGGAMLKHGWIGYKFNEKNNLQLGLTQIPFGITPYNSNSFFFSMNYYLGLEDDHDMGVKYTHTDAHWEYTLAFFKNAEELRFGSNSDVSDSRYAYDVSSIALDGKQQLRNKEINQINGRIAYRFGNETKHKLGVSLFYGGLYNLDTKEVGKHYAAALHYETKIKNFGAKLQATTYNYTPKTLMTNYKKLLH